MRFKSLRDLCFIIYYFYYKIRKFTNIAETIDARIEANANILFLCFTYFLNIFERHRKLCIMKNSAANSMKVGIRKNMQHYNNNIDL